MHKASRGIEEVICYLSSLSGHPSNFRVARTQKFPFWVLFQRFWTITLSFTSQLTMERCTMLQWAQKRCFAVLWCHHSNSKVTRAKKTRQFGPDWRFLGDNSDLNAQMAMQKGHPISRSHGPSNTIKPVTAIKSLRFALVFFSYDMIHVNMPSLFPSSCWATDIYIHYFRMVVRQKKYILCLCLLKCNHTRKQHHYSLRTHRRSKSRGVNARSFVVICVNFDPSVDK